MALDRQSIQRTDFPVARKGYDPAAVDAHLRAIADEVASLQTRPKQGDTLASSASDHVRTIVEAAETSAAEIRREAESDADATRERAQQHARELSASSATMLERLVATKRELESVIESLQAQAGGLSKSDLEAAPGAAPPSQLASPARTGDENGAPAPDSEPAPPVPDSPAAGSEAPRPASETGAPASETAAAPSETAAAPSETAASASELASADAEGARLIALHMALNGTPREETAKYLSEHYRLSDRDKLLDEVYTSVAG